jgi:hypothetical protein
MLANNETRQNWGLHSDHSLESAGCHNSATSETAEKFANPFVGRIHRRSWASASIHSADAQTENPTGNPTVSAEGDGASFENSGTDSGLLVDSPDVPSSLPESPLAEGGAKLPFEIPSTLPETVTTPAAAPPVRVKGDFNADGQIDVLWRNYATGENVVWFMNSSGLIGSEAIAPLAGATWAIRGVEDFNGDDLTDILWYNTATTETLLWFMDGTTRLSELSLGTIGDPNWQLQATGDFSGDGQADFLWRNEASGQNLIWVMQGATLSYMAGLPDAPGANLHIRATGDFNHDGKVDILWQNDLSGENPIWWMDGFTVTGTELLSNLDLNALIDSVPGYENLKAPLLSLLAGSFAADWHIQQVADLDGNGTTEVLLKNPAQGKLIPIQGATANQLANFLQALGVNWQVAAQPAIAAPTSNLVTISNLSFSHNEGDAGTFQVQLNYAPTSAVTLTFDTGNFLVVDADGSIANGMQNTITFTAVDWNQPRTVSFIAEVDDSSQSRLMGNLVSYSLGGELTGSATYDLGSVKNTSAPDPTHFNIDLDFRNDSLGFWTPERRAVAQQAANDWAQFIANEWTGLALNSAIARLDSPAERTVSFTSKRYVDDLLVFVNLFQDNGSGAAALGGADFEFGGWNNSPDPMPRVGQIALDPNVYGLYSDQVLYNAVSHELGHVLGLVGLNWIGYTQLDLTNPQTATFRGEYARAANGGEYIPLQSQDGGDFAHPAGRVFSIMSYGYLYTLSSPTLIDYSMLADSGYQVDGINA